MNHFDQLALRNAGYVSPETQEKLRELTILVAGCGIGSTFAETIARAGCGKLILIDGDTVSPHNLNRQNFEDGDVGELKVKALARRLRAINPELAVDVHAANLTSDNAPELVTSADVVFDTIDFLDLAGIVALHDAAKAARKPVITALAVGWGAGCVYFPEDSDWSFRRLFGLPETGLVSNESYVERFGGVVARLAEHLDPKVVEVVGKALTVMEDGTPCPASQVSPGAASVGALAATLLIRVLAGEPVTEAPHMVVVDMNTALTAPGIDLS